MSSMEKDPPDNNLDETIKVLEYLSKCEPRKAASRRTGIELRAERFANWSLLGGAVGIGIAALLAYWHTSQSLLPDTMKNVVLVLILLSTLSTLASLLTPIVASAWTLARWKTISLRNMLADITHESDFVEALKNHPEKALANAKYWLELKINRAEARVAYFFGEKAAGLALLGTAYVCTKEFGGLPWLNKTLMAGPVAGNLGNTALLMVIALVLGISIGAMLLKHVNARYRFQIELIDNALRR
ncbi:hypothetical protein [Pseudomonas sp. Irchel s3h14]|uniref:hypothetical protein n=1 Tax=Pseudomonas sp. Irchel s3h14 TaxID=2009179 RepID=UPI000BA4CA30|nr:hypothetical protein [Pseudomonas sp. Irchel s3h14]